MTQMKDKRDNTARPAKSDIGAILPAAVASCGLALALLAMLGCGSGRVSIPVPKNTEPGPTDKRAFCFYDPTFVDEGSSVIVQAGELEHCQSLVFLRNSKRIAQASLCVHTQKSEQSEESANLHDEISSGHLFVWHQPRPGADGIDFLLRFGGPPRQFPQDMKGQITSASEEDRRAFVQLVRSTKLVLWTCTARDQRSCPLCN